MILQYVGSRQFRNRLAEFSCNENEVEFAAKVFDILENCFGYDIMIETQWAAIEVDDRDGFNEVMRDYKMAKNIAREIMK